MKRRLILVPTKRVKEAQVLTCEHCGVIQNDFAGCNPFWDIGHSRGMHQRNGMCDPKGVMMWKAVELGATV